MNCASTPACNKGIGNKFTYIDLQTIWTVTLLKTWYSWICACAKWNYLEKPYCASSNYIFYCEAGGRLEFVTYTICVMPRLHLGPGNKSL